MSATAGTRAKTYSADLGYFGLGSAILALYGHAT